jgi:hypothetical protein
VKETMSYNAQDFQVIRIACHYQDCKAVTELAASKVEAAMKKTNACCPVCSRPFTSQEVEGGADIVTMFAKAVLALNGVASQVGIELPVRVDSGNRIWSQV